ncbi:hypothetical protein KW794_01355 [Candidatus Saccharibacteria bacterium]|nr:hypothetical protein [Candidatus Saccharibacteria bacterium]
MRTKKIIKTLLAQFKVLPIYIFLIISFATPTVALAATAPCGDNCQAAGGTSGNTSSTQTKSKNTCDNTTTGGKIDQSKVQKCLTQTPLIQDIQQIVDFLSIGVGIIVTAVILVGGIQYILAGGNAGAITAARQRIINGLIALFAFLFIYTFLQWLIPGGIFK